MSSGCSWAAAVYTGMRGICGPRVGEGGGCQQAGEGSLAWGCGRFPALVPGMEPGLPASHPHSGQTDGGFYLRRSESSRKATVDAHSLATSAD